MKIAKGMSFNRPWGLNRSPHEIEPLYPFTGHNWAQHGLTGRSGHVDRTLDLSVRSPNDSYVSQSQWPLELTRRCAITDRTLSHQRPVISSKVLETQIIHRTCPVMHDRTLPTSGQRP